MTSSSIRIGISSCLTGNEVRYDGAHKLNRYIMQTLGEYFEFVSYCPEVAIGMGVPRPPIRLVNLNGQIEARGVKDPSINVTQSLIDYANKIAPTCKGLAGYIFKSKSPSCGMERVKVYSETGHPVDSASGLFAHSIMAHNPSLPIEEEGRLMDPVLRENFVERVFIYHRWREYVAEGLTPSKLVEFHSRHKFNVLAHDEPIYRELGRVVADAGKGDIQNIAEHYIKLLMNGLKQRSTRNKHVNVLQHIMGFLKKHLSTADKQEMQQVMDDYHRGVVPLIVPITLLKHYLRLYPDDYISSQYYLAPHPKELALLNHI